MIQASTTRLNAYSCRLWFEFPLGSMSKSSLRNTAHACLPHVQETILRDDYEMGTTVDENWQGTAADRQAMATLGRIQELRVRNRSTSRLSTKETSSPRDRSATSSSHPWWDLDPPSSAHERLSSRTFCCPALGTRFCLRYQHG